jgi:hypothetical protein
MLASIKALGAALAIVRPKAGLLAVTKNVSITAARLTSRQHALVGSIR